MSIQKRAYRTKVSNSQAEADSFAWSINRLATPPTYTTMTFYFDEDIGSVDLSVGWEDYDPNGFTADTLPYGLSLSPQGILTGTPTCPPSTNNLTIQSIADSLGIAQSGEITQIETTNNLTIQSVADSLGANETVGVTQETPSVDYVLNFAGDTEITVPVTLDPNQAYTFYAEINADAAASGRAFLGCTAFYLLARNTNVIGVTHWDKLTDGASYSYLTDEWVVVKTPGASGDASSHTATNSVTTHTRGSVTTNSEQLALGAAGIGGAGVNRMLGTLKNVRIWTGDKDAGGTLIHDWAINDNSTTITDSVGTAHGTLTIGTGSWTQV